MPVRFQASDIASRLAAVPEQIASTLLPNGKRDGGYWVAGDTSGSEGKSLRVYLTGPKVGRWADYATEERGDLLDLWAQARCGGDISQDMNEAA
jgi:twinkle protein